MAGFWVLAAGGVASAACDSTSPASNTTANCTGAESTGVIASGSSNVIVNVQPAASITPASGPSIWLGADADIRILGTSTVGNNASADDTNAVLIGNSSTVTVNGTIQAKRGIAGPTQGTGSPGFANADITIAQGGKIIYNGAEGTSRALDGRAGNNVYKISGELDATATAGGELIAVGNNDNITLNATGVLKTLSSGAGAIRYSTATNVTVTTAAGSLIETHGVGANSILVGSGAHLELSGAIRSYGDTGSSGAFGGLGVDVGVGSYVWLKSTGSIITGNNSGLGNKGDGARGITTYVSGTASNSTIIVDGKVDTSGQFNAHGIFAGTGDNITIGATGTVTVRNSGSYAILVRATTTDANHHVTLDIAGRVEQLSTTQALRMQADQGPDLNADVTIEQGGTLYAAANLAYSQPDGLGSYGAVIDNLVVKGTIQRGNSGKAIDLNDGADTITLFPTYSIIGGVDGGSASAGSDPQVDTFAFDGAADTNGTFDFGAIAVTNFEAGAKKGAGHWTLTGTAGTAINGSFAVDAGLLSVNGTMNSTDFVVAANGTLGGSGTIKSFAGAGKIAPGNSIGTLTTGTATFSAGQTYEVELDDVDNHSDRVVATTVTINPTAMVSVLVTPGTYADTNTYLIVDATGGTLTGTFANVVDNSAFVNFTLDYTHDKQVWLKTSIVAALPDVAETPNQIAAAGGIDEQGPSTALFDAILPLGADAARNAFDLSSGEIHATLEDIVLDDTRFIREAVLQRLNDAFGPGSEASGGADPARPRLALWAQGFGSSGSGTGDGNAAGYSRSIGGLVAGVDGGEPGAWRAGAAVSYQRASLSVPDRASSATADSFAVAAYGGVENGAVALRFGGAASSGTIDTVRNDTFGGFSEVLTARYGARTGQLFAEAAYRAKFGNVAVEPFAGVARVAVDTDAFTEAGGAAALTAASEHHVMTIASFGARFAAPLPATHGRLTALVAWQHRFGDTTPTASLAFAGGSAFTVAGVPRQRDSLRIEAGMEWDIGRRSTLSLAYSGQIASGASDHGAKARFAIRF
ncbi:MAG: autotransporter domain-containing protein [Bauldia sp.]